MEPAVFSYHNWNFHFFSLEATLYSTQEEPRAARRDSNLPLRRHGGEELRARRVALSLDGAGSLPSHAPFLPSPKMAPT